MQRNVYLEGELGERFGHKYVIEGNTYHDIFGCINANQPDFREFALECHSNDISFHIQVEEQDQGEEDLLEPLKEGDITIAIIPAGAILKSIAKIVGAVFIAYLTFATFGAAGASFFGQGIGGSFFGGAFAGTLGTFSLGGVLGGIGMGIAVGLASRGLGELMAPDGSVDEPASNNYLFQGNSPNRQQGEPVPLLYGQLRVPGRAISSNVINGIYVNPDARIDYRGNVYTVDETKYEENIGAFSG
tara:strand:+ start:355 stop:1089 length:735 start_codon:yes stop_codon:yes gene_type:complete